MIESEDQPVDIHVRPLVRLRYLVLKTLVAAVVIVVPAVWTLGSSDSDEAAGQAVMCVFLALMACVVYFFILPMAR